ncbi:hypothetical protein QN277_006544 [Acacia crassicarpa]|uniref:Bidirectional sugar transporter SWEET n=1 Tax=Acacia crassicarpa TaxID=499986 RepID=A0AAE1ITQ7_9FABA|nr:hypothetical protein QN277_006544 [Acacia crassicarpa]
MDIHHFAFVFGLMGNIISFLVLLAPAPTFYQIYKKKSTEGFHSLPYVVSLLSCMIWIYYAFLKKNTGLLLITINSFGCVLESIYISIFLFYASKKLRISTIKLVLLLNVFGYGSMLLSTLYLAEGSKRINIVGWVSLVFNISVFAAPLSSMRRVIKTKSVEFMPFNLSMCLTLNAVMWFFYGLSLKDYYIALPNTIGFLFGIVQMVLYLMYKNPQPLVMEDPVKVQNHQSDHIIEVAKLSSDNKNDAVTQDHVESKNKQNNPGDNDNV